MVKIREVFASAEAAIAAGREWGANRRYLGYGPEDADNQVASWTPGGPYAGDWEVAFRAGLLGRAAPGRGGTNGHRG